MKMPTRAGRGAFTLIELLVVIFIISILIAATLTIISIVKRAVAGAQTSAQLAAKNQVQIEVIK
jgi:prepilin-type N-terminal cleavage/methylation domain-containing protein